MVRVEHTIHYIHDIYINIKVLLLPCISMLITLAKCVANPDKLYVTGSVYLLSYACLYCCIHNIYYLLHVNILYLLQPWSRG